MSSTYVAAKDFDLERSDSLSFYQWGDRAVNHYFCRRCGIYTFHEAVERPGQFRVNLGCLEDFDTTALTVTLVDGKSF